MNVLPVSLNFTSSKTIDNYDLSYLYQQEPKHKKNNNKLLQQYTLTTAALAVSAVMIALYNLGSKQKFHSNIVEVPDLAKGLNKIKEHEDFIEAIKRKFVYPIKAADLGDNKIINSDDYKTGMIITGNDRLELRRISDALKEHFEMLGIDTVFIKQSIKKEKDGQIYSKRMKKNELVKKFFTEVEKAKEKYKNTGKYTIISLGRFEDFTSLKITKSTQSKIDDLIVKINQKDIPGVIWFAWTTESKSIPLYFNELPILVAKMEN